jgi:hypothetical protein
VGKGMGGRIPRADVAAFMLQQVTDGSWVQKAPVITSQR